MLTSDVWYLARRLQVKIILNLISEVFLKANYYCLLLGMQCTVSLTISTIGNKRRLQSCSAIFSDTFAFSQVEELKTEMDVVSGEVQAQEEGYEKLKKVDRKLSSHRGCRKEDVQVLVEEIQSMQRTLFVKEQEKNDLIQALLRLKDKLSQPDSSNEVRSGDSLMHVGVMLASLDKYSL